MNALQLSLVDDPAVMNELAPDWHALWRRADGRFAESPVAGRLAWSHGAGPAGGRLAVLTGRCAGELVLVLPMAVQRRGPLRLLRPLGPGAADYTALLMDPRSRSEAEAALGEAWSGFAGSAGADVVQLPSVATASPLHTLAARNPATRVIGTDLLPLARARAGETFEQYGADLGKLSHHRVGGLRRRLAKTGEVRVEVPEPGDPVVPELLDWLLRRKQDWARQAGRVGPWLFDPAYRAYLLAVLRPGPEGPDGPDGGSPDGGGAAGRMLVVRLDGAPVGVAVLGLGVSLAEGLIVGHDPAFNRYSPGLIVVEACVEWAFAQRMGLDLGVGSEAYKQYWSRGDVQELINLQVPLNVRGRLALNARGAVRRAIALSQR